MMLDAACQDSCCVHQSFIPYCSGPGSSKQTLSLNIIFPLLLLLLSQDSLGSPVLEVELNVGDVLYMPRGTVHQAVAADEGDSDHLTISTYQRSSYADLATHMLQVRKDGCCCKVQCPGPATCRAVGPALVQLSGVISGKQCTLWFSDEHAPNTHLQYLQYGLCLVLLLGCCTRCMTPPLLFCCSAVMLRLVLGLKMSLNVYLLLLAAVLHLVHCYSTVCTECWHQGRLAAV